MKKYLLLKKTLIMVLEMYMLESFKDLIKIISNSKQDQDYPSQYL